MNRLDKILIKAKKDPEVRNKIILKTIKDAVKITKKRKKIIIN